MFLFNTRNELLMQQRSQQKITFPGLWTNTCCSHPEHSPQELDTGSDWVGPRRAAIRRTKFELGISLDLLDLTCGSRILYQALADDMFQEYELDYIVFAKKQVGDFAPNPDEVQAHEWVSQRDFGDFIQDKAITPWFELIMQAELPRWWRLLQEKGRFPNEAEKITSFMRYLILNPS